MGLCGFFSVGSSLPGYDQGVIILPLRAGEDQ
jgi:hypothetical protein